MQNIFVYMVYRLYICSTIQSHPSTSWLKRKRKMKTFAKQRRQINRKRQTKSTRLTVKQACNQDIKRYMRDKSLSENTRKCLIDISQRIKSEVGF